MAASGLQILQQLANLQPAVDEYGSVLQPLPRAHRGLADPSCLPHIAQVILTGETYTETQLSKNYSSPS